MAGQKTFLCISCDYKGGDFLRALHELNQRVFLVTSEKTREEAWPRECLEDIFYMPERDGRKWDIQTLIQGTAFLFRKNAVDKIIALDDYDVWKAADLREEFRSPGMGQTTARHFYDKLAMRMRADEHNIRIPGYSGLFTDHRIEEFLDASEPPWVVKPRTDAGALGIRKLYSKEDFWRWNEMHQEDRYRFLIEEFKPGAVYHVDTLLKSGKTLFTRTSQYLQPPFEVAHEGGVFRSHTMEIDHPDSLELKKLNDAVLSTFGLRFGASHTEFIKEHETGEFYFLETSARVGGAHLADMVEAASGINLWREWAKIELAELNREEYVLPKHREENGGIVVTLSKYAHPDYSAFDDSSIVWQLNKKYHIGLIFRHPSRKHILDLLDKHTQKIFEAYYTTVPLKE